MYAEFDNNYVLFCICVQETLRICQMHLKAQQRLLEQSDWHFITGFGLMMDGNYYTSLIMLLSKAGVSNSRPGGQIRPATSFSVAYNKRIIFFASSCGRACKEYNTFIIRLHATLQKQVAHKQHVPQCISFCDMRTEETCNYLPWTSAFRRG